MSVNDQLTDPLLLWRCGPAGRLEQLQVARSCHDDQVSDNHDGETEPIRVLVVDDQELFRRGLTMLLGVESGIEVVGEAGDGIEGTALAAAVAPDVVLADVRMPKRRGYRKRAGQGKRGHGRGNSGGG